MKYIATIITSLAIAAVASAGTSAPMPSAGKGKAVVAPQPAPCPDMLKYSYLEAGWIRLDADDADIQNGGYLDASYEIIPHLLAPVVRDQIRTELHAIGFRFVTIDLDGFRSGSLNNVISIEQLLTANPR